MTEYLRRKIRALMMSGRVSYSVSDYVQDGLNIHLDAIKNTDSGHDSSATTWTDLSGNGRDFTLKGCTWKNKALSFAMGNYAIGAEFNPKAITVEVVFKVTDLSPIEANKEINIIGNLESGGAGIQYGPNQKTWRAAYHNGTGYQRGEFKFEEDKVMFVSFTLDSENFKVYSGGLTVSEASGGTLKAPTLNTVWALGANPSGTGINGNSNNLAGEIYAVRLYNRALTEAEIAKNYSIDEARFK